MPALRKPPSRRPMVLEPFYSAKNGTKLVVVARGLGKSIFIKDVLTATSEILPDADIFTLRYNSNIWSNQTAPELVSFLARQIGEVWDRKAETEGPYKSVILIGHSIGALLVRGAYLLAQGYRFSSADVPGSTAWSEHVDRIVSLAGLSNGWKYPKVGLLRAPLLRAIRFYADTFDQARYMMSVAEGSPFIVDLRLHWLDRISPYGAGADGTVPAITHIRGERDDLVKKEDLDDLQRALGFKGRSVQAVAHFNIGVFTKDTATAIRDEYSKRPSLWNCLRHPCRSAAQYLKIFAFAWLLEDDTTAAEHEFLARREELADALGQGNRANQFAAPAAQDPTVTAAIMIKHGIRDFASGWPDRLGQKIVTLARAENPPRNVIASAAGYQYFSLFQFLVPGARVARVRRIMNEYTDMRARYPKAKVSYIGHSYGTYLLCRALRAYHSLEFDRVILAGSVVCTDFAWQPIIDAGRVRQVRNIRATSDWIVAVFPGSFEKLRTLAARHQTWWSDILGYGGVHGFNDTTNALRNISFRGGHGAGISNKRHESLARFILGDDAALQDDQRKAKIVEVGWLTRLAATFSFVAVAVLLAGFGMAVLQAYDLYGIFGAGLAVAVVILFLNMV